jgi:hypothetical protein
MSTLRTFNLQNPDSGTVNIEMDQGGNTLMTGIATVRGAAHFTSTSGSDAVGIGTDITAYKLDVRVTGAEAGLRVYNPDTSSNASGIIRLGNDDNQNSAFLKLNGANNSSTVGGAANLVLGTGTAREVHLATNGTSRLNITSAGDVNIKGGNLFVGTDAATLNFTDSNSNTRFIEIGANGGSDGGDALLITHSGTSGVGYFGYEAGGDRLVVACDNGSGTNKIDFIVNAGTTTGGSTDNLNNVSPALRITGGGHLVIGSGYADFQSGNRGEASSTDPYKLVFQNQYSDGFTDEKLKLYLFNSGNTRQGLGPGPNYDLQYHSSGGAPDQAKHRFYTDNVLRMEIADSYTGVTKPTQPGFYARRTAAGDGRAAGAITEWHISGTGAYNEGGHFKTSGTDQGKFVAPVTGKYYFAAQPGYKQSGLDFQFYFRINSVVINEPVRVIDGGDDLVSHSGFTGTCIVYMAAGQKLDVYINYTHHVNTTYNFFCGYLIG